MNFGNVSNLRGSDRGRAALMKMLLVSPFLRYLDRTSALELDATDYEYRTKEGSLSAQNRVRGGSYTQTNLTPGARQTGSQYFHGFGIDIDQADIADSIKGLRDLSAWIDNELPE